MCLIIKINTAYIEFYVNDDMAGGCEYRCYGWMTRIHGESLAILVSTSLMYA